MRLSFFNKVSENRPVFYRKEYITVTLEISITSDVQDGLFRCLQLEGNVFHQRMLNYVSWGYFSNATPYSGQKLENNLS